MTTTVEVKKMSPEEKEAFHQAAEAGMKTFHYSKPEPKRKGKDWVDLCSSSLMNVVIQVVKEGGENNLHYHQNSDTCWYVLKGRVRYYGVGDKLLGEFGEHEGIFIPGGSRYWFEKVGAEDLEILKMTAIDRSKGKSLRINLEPHKEWMNGESFLQVYEKAEQ